ncbi:hypothetical protein PLANPX_3807 [Lacipirellula parvula]|uniref:Uncharacterized protein n=1 Tax=Lacipirellula parvula TaxID=2650471 RepID=A0A5K7XCT8_9BACT|nr:hypothetical protein PLANPX_3807 [Lacipirellula parvula]
MPRHFKAVTSNTILLSDGSRSEQAPSLQHALRCSQQVGFADNSLRAAATTKIGTFTPFFSAHSIFWVFVKQQQSRQQVSASVQPQGQF